MAVYDMSGNVIATNGLSVNVADIKSENPLLNDDQILDLAIAQAKALGRSSEIMWDGTDIHFTGSVTHECKGFGGIDFCGSKIYMPDYNEGIILDIVPDATEDITVSASTVLKTRTTNSDLYGKIFALNTVNDGNADMCLGYRYGNSGEIVLYSVPIIKASPDGKYETGDLYMTPQSGTVTCYNVHSYPAITFELRNAIIVSSSTANMSTLARCTRSNTHIHNFTLEGRSNITAFNWGIFNCINCVGIEIDHISGINPVQKANTSGYFMGLSSVGFCHVHDLMVGDSISWGAMGCRFLTQTVFERCYLNRWDCHFAQFGINTIKDCVLNNVLYGVGNGSLIVNNCLLIMAQTSSDPLPMINLRVDCPGAFDGDIIVRNCKFISDSQPTNLVNIWDDSCLYQKPSNSKISGSPKRYRIIENCQLIDDCKTVFLTGATASADMSMLENLTYKIKDCNIVCTEAIIKAVSAGQNLDSFEIIGCSIDGNTLKNVSCKLIVNGSKVDEITTDTTLPNVIAVGNIFSGSQSVSNFTAYALAGNIAADMASVNKHSN